MRAVKINETTRIGIIGLGKMGISHLSIANTHSGVKVLGACDASGFITSGLAKVCRIPLFNDYHQMLNSCDLDAVIVATPTSSHKKIVSDCLRKGLHVFVEKPFCLKLDEGKEMVNDAVKRNVVNQVCFHNKFIVKFQKVKDYLDSNLIGDIYHIIGEAYGPVVLKPKGMTWRTQKSEGGGCLHDYASHVLDLMIDYVGVPSGAGGTVLQKIYSREVEDAVFSTLYYPKGLTGRLSVNWSEETYRKMSTQLTLFGKKGKIIVDRQECKIYLKEYNKQHQLDKGWNILNTTELTRPVWFYLRGEEYSAQLDYFIQSIKSNRTKNTVNSFESALQTDSVIEMLIQNAK